MDAVFYWDMTLHEILTTIKVYSKKQAEELQSQAVVAYRQADMIARLVGIMLGGKQTPPTLIEAFPGFFPEQEKLAEAQKTSQQNWQIMKARIEAYAAEKRNQNRGEMHGNDAGRTSSPDIG